MALLTCLYLAFYLLFISHSTLLYFLVDQSSGRPVPVRSVVFPLPSKGKMVSALAFLASVLFFILVPVVYPADEKEWNQFWHGFPTFLSLVIFPLCFYFLYIFKRIRTERYGTITRLVFVTRHASRAELLLPIAAAALLNVVFRFFK